MAWGYWGGLLDGATGLVYIGNGQYYDPVTGRLLSPSGRGRNPYLPASRGDPLGAAIGPVALIALLATRRRRKKDKWNGVLLVALFMVMGVGMGAGLTACNPPPTETPQPPQPPQPQPQPPQPQPPGGGTPQPQPPPTDTPVPPTRKPARLIAPVKFSKSAWPASNWMKARFAEKLTVASCTPVTAFSSRSMTGTSAAESNPTRGNSTRRRSPSLGLTPVASGEASGLSS